MLGIPHDVTVLMVVCLLVIVVVVAFIIKVNTPDKTIEQMIQEVDDHYSVHTKYLGYTTEDLEKILAIKVTKPDRR